MIRERTARGNAGPLFWSPTIEGLFNYEYVRDNPEKLDDPSWQAGVFVFGSALEGFVNDKVVVRGGGRHGPGADGARAARIAARRAV